MCVANKFINDEQPIINGDGLITRDYIYISDVVEANFKSLEDEVNGIYNVTSGIETNVNEIFQVLKSKTNSTAEEFHGPAKKGEQRRSVCSFEKFNSNHNWSPQVKFIDGIDKTVKYFKQSNK